MKIIFHFGDIKKNRLFKYVQCSIVIAILGDNLAFGQKSAIKDSSLFVTELNLNVINVEPGISLKYILGQHYYSLIAYSHPFYGFHIVENGDEGSDLKYWPYHGNNLSVGIGHSNKSFFSQENKISFLELRATFREMTVPKYCNRHGSNGLCSILRETVSEDRDYVAFQLFFRITRIIERETNYNIFWQLFFGAGYQYRSIVRYKYEFGTNCSCNSNEYPPGTKENETNWLPRINMGILIGLNKFW